MVVLSLTAVNPGVLIPSELIIGFDRSQSDQGTGPRG